MVKAGEQRNPWGGEERVGSDPRFLTHWVERSRLAQTLAFDPFRGGGGLGAKLPVFSVFLKAVSKERASDSQRKNIKSHRVVFNVSN